MKIEILFKENKIFDINSLFEFCKEKLKYGWLDGNNIYYETPNYNKYFIQTPEELLKSKVSICWDRTELYRVFFEKNNYNIETYLLYYDLGKSFPSHSILVFYYNNKVFWFEPMFNDEKYNYCGIHKYNNLNDLLKDCKKRFTEYGILNKFLPSKTENLDFYCYKYSKPEIHLSDTSFYKHCQNGKRIFIK